MNNTKAYLEHANIAVKDLDQTIKFIQTALPEFEIRFRGTQSGTNWAHVGTENSYLALVQRADQNTETEHLNHLGFVVSDITAVTDRLRAAGYERSYPKTLHEYRIREYFNDDEGMEYEFVQYLSSKTKDRNDYSDINK